MTDSDTIPIWKKIYQVVSGFNTGITKDVIEDILKMCKDQLVTGLLEYKPYTKESYNDWIKKKKFDDEDSMNSFINLTSVQLDLEAEIAWGVICNFLMFEYYGKVNALKCIINFETGTRCLIDNIYIFYSSERMFLLKILRFILEQGQNPKHKFHAPFNKFLKSIDMRKLWDNILKMFKNSVFFIDKEKASKCFHIESLVLRNDQEQIELVLLMINILQYLTLTGSELTDLLNLFLTHSFARHSLYDEASKYSKKETTQHLKYCEIGCLFVVAHKYWENPDMYKTFSPELEKDINMLEMQQENGIVLLLCTVLKASVTQKEEAYEACNNLLERLTSRKIFECLHSLASNKIFKKSSTGYKILAGINKFLMEFSSMCSEPKFLFVQPGVVPLVAVLLGHEEFKARVSFAPVITVAVEAFPSDFHSFVTIFKSLVLSDCRKEVIHFLNNLPTYLADATPMPNQSEGSLYQKKRIFNDTPRILQEPQRLFDGNDIFVVPADSSVAYYELRGDYHQQFRFSYSFFKLMEQYMGILVTTKLKFPQLISRITNGYELILNILEKYDGVYEHDHGLKSCIKHLDVIPMYFFKGNLRNYDLIRLYFSVNFKLVMKGLLKFEDAFNISLRKNIFNTKYIKELSIPQLFRDALFDGNALHYCLQEEESHPEHEFLMLYIKFVGAMVKTNQIDPMVMGVWHLLTYVVPHHTKWRYEHIYQKAEITKACTTVFVEVLQKQYPCEDPLVTKLFDCVLYGFLHEDWILKSYLTFLKKGKNFLRLIMSQETDWIKGSSTVILDNARQQIAFLLLLMKHKHIFTKQNYKLVISGYIDVITKSISGYLINAYCVNLVKLCCKFLEVVAREKNYPLLSFLGLDFDQVQSLFLDRLRDPLEDDDVKYDIIELINTCIAHQNGMTAAFFNVQCSKKWYAVESVGDDTVNDFMIDYLQNIRKSSEYLKHPLQLGILRIMSTLWISKRYHLINDIIELEQFWWLLADPLWRNFDNKPEVYKCILKIFNIELYNDRIKKFNAEHVDDGGDSIKKKCNFQKVLDKFMMNENIDKWLKYLLKVFANLKTEDETDEAIELLKAWTEFLVMLDVKYPVVFSNDNMKILIMESSLDGLTKDFASDKIVNYWIDLCLLFLSKWSVHFGEKDEVMINKLVFVSRKLSMYQKGLSPNTRQAFLCTINSVIISNKKYFQNQPEILVELLESLSVEIEVEYEALQQNLLAKLKEDPYCRDHSPNGWLLVITIVNSVMSLKCVKECRLWIYYKNYFNKLLESTPDLLKYKFTLPLARASLHSLVLLIESPLAREYMCQPLRDFYDTIEAPLLALLIQEKRRPDYTQFIDIQDGWFLCTLLVKFTRALLNEFEVNALKNCFLFFTLNESIIQHILTLTESTVDFNALDLVYETLVLIERLFYKWDRVWYCQSNKTYNVAILGIQRTINSCISLILRPKNIIFHPIGVPDRESNPEMVATELMITAINKLITIVGMACNCLYRLNPGLIGYLGPIDEEQSLYNLINNDFSVPNLDAPITSDLTYGRLLCLAHNLCKTLNQIEQKSKGKTPITEEMGLRKKFIGLVEYQAKVDDIDAQRHSAFFHGFFEYTGLQDPWVARLNAVHVRTGLEMLMLFIADQVTLALNSLPPSELQFYQRNLNSELQFFNDYVKRRTVELLKTELMPTLRTTTNTEKDLFRRFLIGKWMDKKYDDVITENFLLVISLWFSNICHLT